MAYQHVSLGRSGIVAFGMGIAITAGFGWFAYYDHAKHGDVFSLAATVNHAATCQAATVPGLVVFYYADGTTPERVLQIIAGVQGAIKSTYASLHGYEIAVPMGGEDAAIAKLRSYPEVVNATRAHSCA